MSTSYEDTKKTSVSEEDNSIRWEDLLPEGERFSLRERSVVDAALSIADEVLGNSNTENPELPKALAYKTNVPEMPKQTHSEKESRASVNPVYGEKTPKPSIKPIAKEDISQSPMQDVYKAGEPEASVYETQRSETFPGQDVLNLPPIEDIPHGAGSPDKEKAPRKKRYRGIKIATGLLIAVAVLIACGFVFINNMLNRMQYDIPLEVLGGNTVAAADDVDINLVLRNEGIRKEETVVPVDYDGEDVLNFLLIGEEAIGDAEGTNGRSDTMIVLTVNLKKNTIKLTSFMRDLYLNIPGYGQNRLNAAFMFGGSELVEQTLNVNYGVYVDGYLKVNFDGFKKIINKVGGVDITLTEAEAEYLNSTNYIKEKKYRNVVPGPQTLNGSQALGYSRIRYVKGISEENDFGRTARQRMVLTAAYDKIKDLNAFDMLTLVYEVLPYITTNVSKDKLIEYAKMAISLDFETIESYRIPADGTFQFASVRIGNVPASIIMADETLNRQALYDFLYDGDVPEHLSGTAQGDGTGGQTDTGQTGSGQTDAGKTTLEDANQKTN